MKCLSLPQQWVDIIFDPKSKDQNQNEWKKRGKVEKHICIYGKLITFELMTSFDCSWKFYIQNRLFIINSFLLQKLGGALLCVCKYSSNRVDWNVVLTLELEVCGWIVFKYHIWYLFWTKIADKCRLSLCFWIFQQYEVGNLQSTAGLMASFGFWFG